MLSMLEVLGSVPSSKEGRKIRGKPKQGKKKEKRRRTENSK